MPVLQPTRVLDMVHKAEAYCTWGHSPGVSANLDIFGHRVSIFW